MFSPSSDKRFWNALRTRIDALLEDQNSKISTPTVLCTEEDSGKQGEPDKGLKRKYHYCSEDQGTESKNLVISMATRAVSLAKELKSVTQERCSLLEENRQLREGFSKGIRPEEDEPVRLQLQAQLAEKSRLANENPNLVRENQCLNQLVQHCHQLTSQEDFPNAWECA